VTLYWRSLAPYLFLVATATYTAATWFNIWGRNLFT
jgi:hypothetical protein